MSDTLRIAKALEERNEIVMGILYGLLAVTIIVATLLVVLTFGQSVYDYINYDVLNNERPPTLVYSVVAGEPIDDCNFSEDEQLCYQMKRIADALERQQNIVGASHG